MKFILSLLAGLLVTLTALGAPMISEVVYVESPTDTDRDGKKDLIYVSIDRPASDKKLSSLFHISPYALGGNEVPMHNVDMDLLPQDEVVYKFLSPEVKMAFKGQWKNRFTLPSIKMINAPRYAQIKAHSVGTGRSTGCPTVGDMSETLAAKAVIDWLNGRAKAFKENGEEIKADWANGNVGMTGTSYDGTLPIMVATTGVEGLKAIIPVAAISNWYDYYRANGLVVNPGGYIGEDADILGYFIARKGDCQTELNNIKRMMGREHGDFTPFWQARDYLPMVKNIKAATFIIHGQNDWNVKQKHAIQLWEALDSAPKRMFLHRGGHSSTWNHGVPKKVQDWFDHFVDGVDNDITRGPQVEVELPDSTLITQNEWPHEDSKNVRLFLSKDSSLTSRASANEEVTIKDSGKTDRIETLISQPDERKEGRLLFLSDEMQGKKLLTGTSRVNLKLAIMNRKAANITVAVVEYDRYGRGKIITRGWADPQNYKSIKRGKKLIPGEEIELSFTLEPKEALISSGSKIGVLVASTDYEYTLRPKGGTEIKVSLGENSFIDLKLADY